MSGITTREQFLQVLGDAERVALGLAPQSAPDRRQLLHVLAQHLAYARATLADGAFPTPEQKAAVDLGSVTRQLAPGPGGENTDAHTAWLFRTLPMVAAFYQSFAPPRDFPLGCHVCVRWPTGQRYLGFVRFIHEKSYLVAFATGMQQWMQAAQLEPPPARGEQLAALAADGQQVTGTLTDFEQGQYQLELGEGRSDWFEWTRVRPL